jgi:8-oxo-dGTP pyrophosphatase MutT (NUDIX family)
MCPAEGCGFVHYGEHSIGTGAVVFREGRVLLIERRTGTRSWWQIPGGYVEVDESIDVAMEREVMEETGVTARITEVPTVSSMSHWAIEQAVLAESTRGLLVEPSREGLHRPGHTFYGLPR